MKTRNKDFLAVCKRIVEESRGERLTSRRLVKRAIESNAPSYYVTFDYAYRMLRRMRNGTLPRDYNRIRKRQWEEIMMKVDRVKESYGMRDDATALGMVLAGGRASGFFISHEYGLKLYRKLKAVG